MATPNRPGAQGTRHPVPPLDAVEPSAVEKPRIERPVSAKLDPSLWLNYALIVSGVSTLAAVAFIIWGVGADNITLVAIGLIVFILAASLWGATLVILTCWTLKQLWPLAKPLLRRNTKVRPDSQGYVQE